jgi:hypothetical protein
MVILLIWGFFGQDPWTNKMNAIGTIPDGPLRNHVGATVLELSPQQRIAIVEEIFSLERDEVEATVSRRPC